MLHGILKVDVDSNNKANTEGTSKDEAHPSVTQSINWNKVGQHKYQELTQMYARKLETSTDNEINPELLIDNLITFLYEASKEC